MYKDEIWYRKLESAVNGRRDDFSDKQWRKFQVGRLLRTANRVRETSESCETCQSYQHTLTRLEEEFAELPDSKAQRQYQAEQLREMGQHFVRAHGFAPSGYFLRYWLRMGLRVGALAGFLGMIIGGNLLLLPVGIVLVGAVSAAIGYVVDQKYERERRRI